MHSHAAQAVNRKASTTLFVRAHRIRNTTQTSATHTSKRVDMEGFGGIVGTSFYAGAPSAKCSSGSSLYRCASPVNLPSRRCNSP